MCCSTIDSHARHVKCYLMCTQDCEPSTVHRRVRPLSPGGRAIRAASTLLAVDRAIQRAMTADAELAAVVLPGFFGQGTWNVRPQNLYNSTRRASRKSSWILNPAEPVHTCGCVNGHVRRRDCCHDRSSSAATRRRASSRRPARSAGGCSWPSSGSARGSSLGRSTCCAAITRRRSGSSSACSACRSTAAWCGRWMSAARPRPRRCCNPSHSFVVPVRLQRLLAQHARPGQHCRRLRTHR